MEVRGGIVAQECEFKRMESFGIGVSESRQLEFCCKREQRNETVIAGRGGGSRQVSLFVVG